MGKALKTDDQKSNPRWRARFVFVAWTVFASILIAEVGIRGFFSTKVGPSVWFYGTQWAVREVDPFQQQKNDANHTVKHHRNEMGSYSKYFPYQERVDHDPATGEIYRVTINNRGFRGRDIVPEKPAGVLRVITLGGSSTFGYYDRDHETYPHYLEEYLNERTGDDYSFEVINLAVPHMRSDQIHSIFMAEALPLQPDVVTFYEGVNDSAFRGTPTREGEGENDAKRKPVPAAFEGPIDMRDRLSRVAPLRSLYRFMRAYLVSVKLVDTLIVTPGKVYSKDEFEHHLRGKSDHFVKHLDMIREECHKRGIVFVLANQQAQSLSIDSSELSEVSYWDESKRIQRKLERKGFLTYRELCFLTHNVLMMDLSEWAQNENVPFVDIIAELDSSRDVLLSWVHLSPAGNRMIANAFADEILSQLSVRSRRESNPETSSRSEVLVGSKE